MSTSFMVIASDDAVFGVGINTGDVLCSEVTLEEQMSILTEKQQELLLKKLEASKNYQRAASRSDRWPFEYSGHCMCISGSKSDQAQYMVADSYVGYAYTNGDPTYEQSAQLIYDAIQLRGGGKLFLLKMFQSEERIFIKKYFGYV